MRTPNPIPAMSAVFLTVLLLAASTAVLAEPPDWAPAHGYRNQHDDDEGYSGKKHGKHKRHKKDEEEDDDDHDNDDHENRHGKYRKNQRDDQYWGGYDPRYSSRYGSNDYGIQRGTCNHTKLSGYQGGGSTGGNLNNMLGNAVSGALGQQGNPLVGAIAGAVIGQMLGNKADQSMDQGDRACFSQALEYGYDQRPVSWSNRSNNSQYQIVPLRSFQDNNGNWCREFSYRVTQNGQPLDNFVKTACRLGDGSWQ